MAENYKQTVAGTIGAGMKSVLSGGGKKYYILEHKVSSAYHRAGDHQEIIVDQIEIGRDPQCQVRFDDSEMFKTVSRRHAAIVRDGDNWKLVQLSSTNKTFLNGVPVQKEWFLQNGDEIQLSVNGPKLGFIIPSGNNSTTKSIGLSRRLSLFRQQALRPYKTAMTILSIVLVLVIAAGAFFIIRGNQENKELRRMYYEDSVRRAAEIDSLNLEIQKLGIDNNKFWNDLKRSKPSRQDGNSKPEKINIIIDEDLNDGIDEDFYEETPEGTLDAPEGNKPAASNADTSSRAPAPAATPSAPSTKSTGLPKSVSDNVYYIQVVSYTIEYEGEQKTVEPGDFIGDMQVDGWLGTAFLLSDGKLVTARHCVEGWYYELTKSTKWQLHINSLATEGAKVTVNLAAVSPKGDYLELSSKDVLCNRSKDKRVTFDDGTILTMAKDNDFDDMDFAWFKTNLKGGLSFDKELSKKLKIDTPLKIYGFPHGWGMNGIKNIRPIMGSGIVAQDGLESGIILLGSASFESGHSGSPAFYIDKNGNYTVVGIVSSRTPQSYGIIVPILKIN